MSAKLKNPWYKLKNNPSRIFFISLLLFALALLKIYFDVFSPNVDLKYAKGKTYLLVHSGDNLDNLLQRMENNYYLNNIVSFRRLATLLKLDEKMKPGRYLLRKDMSNYELLKMIMNGRQEPIDVVLKYEERPEDLAGFFASQLEIDSSEFFNLLRDTSIIQPLGFDTNTIVAMFIPNTYNFYWNTNRIALLNRMNNEYKKFWTTERIAKAMACNLSQIEVSILASIVQKESNKGDEMPVIAGTYLNRLRIGMPLQADPTIIYAWNDKSIRRVTNLHTAIVSPYNTYENVGLPPGPICTPSIQAIDAVLNYEKHNYLYFCAKEDFSGYHAFAHSLDQHQQNARRYQRALNQRQIH